MDGAKKPATTGQPPSNRVIKANRTTLAAKWNREVLRGLEKALLKDPEANLATLLAPSYPGKLESFKSVAPST
jgi:hypothetical protein